MADLTAMLQAAAGNVAGGDYQISRSLRFNPADSAYLSRTPASASNQKTFTWSGWVKRCAVDADHQLMAQYTDGSNRAYFTFRSGNTFLLFNRISGVTNTQLETTQVFRDVSAWYHVVVAVDTTQATSTNRVKIYINGTQVTAFGTATYPNQNDDFRFNSTGVHRIASYDGTGDYYNGYMADINFIDGQALTPSSFGETDAVTGVWKPIAYAGTYGTNGFYLDFSDNTSTTTLGYDAAGSNDWTLNNFSVAAGAGNDSLVDSPTRYGTDTGAGGEVRGNYCTLNPLITPATMTIVNGNLDLSGYTGVTSAYGTFGMSSGKWYFEYIVYANGMGGISGTPNGSSYPGQSSDSYAWDANNAGKYNNGIFAAYGNATSNGDIVGVAFDADAGTLVFYKNGVSQGTAYSSIPSKTYFPVFRNADSGGNLSINFGQRPFAHTAPSGFKALVTTNLPDPTVVQGDDYFNTVLWDGTGGARTITGVGFQPDWVWAKGRSGAATYPNLIWDAVRGTNLNLITNSTGAEFNAATGSSNGGLGTSASDGFTIVSGTATADNLNASSPASTYVAWNWKANGAGVSNTDGTITSTASANTTAGISIVTYTGTGANATVGHGLGVAPKMIIVKSRSAVDIWPVYHQSIGNTQYLRLQGTNPAGTFNVWQNTNPTSSVFYISTDTTVNTNTATYVAYCFAEVEGFSKFSSYVGNGSADGSFIFTGFKVAWVMIKRTDNLSEWAMYDLRRPGFNPNYQLRANATDAENSNSAVFIDLVSNGFKIRTSDAAQNASGGTYIFAAFAENPFKTSLAR